MEVDFSFIKCCCLTRKHRWGNSSRNSWLSFLRKLGTDSRSIWNIVSRWMESLHWFLHVYLLCENFFSLSDDLTYLKVLLTTPHFSYFSTGSLNLQWICHCKNICITDWLQCPFLLNRAAGHAFLRQCRIACPLCWRRKPAVINERFLHFSL